MTLGIGVIGCGLVSHAYLGTIVRTGGVDLRAVASLSGVSAIEQAKRYGSSACSIDAMFDRSDVDLIVLLSPPETHAPLGRHVIESGKHLYVEKPLATSLADAAELVALARDGKRLIGCAPDTFLGPAHQCAARLIAEGEIGRVTGGRIIVSSAGMEHWHPRAAPFYARGGGPLLDIGPYHLTLLVHLLGPVAEVIALTGRALEIRRGRSGDRINVDVPTTVEAAMRFANGALIGFSLSWDAPFPMRPIAELIGEKGMMRLADANGFAGEVDVSSDGKDWVSHGDGSTPQSVSSDTLASMIDLLERGIDPLTGAAVNAETALRLGDLRGLGLIDLARAIETGTPPKSDAAIAVHVLETLLAIEASATSGKRIAIARTAFPG